MKDLVDVSSEVRVNDFVIKIGNVNGTGSASANGLLMKAIFRMGVPVVGKNLFPSNIQGLPTWYEIRITRDSYFARSGTADFVVAMNAETYARDLAEVSPGGFLLYDSTWPRPDLHGRSDIMTSASHRRPMEEDRIMRIFVQSALGPSDGGSR